MLTAPGYNGAWTGDWGTKLGLAGAEAKVRLLSGARRRRRRLAMSWSSVSSASPGFRRASGRRDAGTRSSPVAYREGAMAYELARYCHCDGGGKRKVPRWISWSRQNPDRRYYACVSAMVSSDFSANFCSAQFFCSIFCANLFSVM